MCICVVQTDVYISWWYENECVWYKNVWYEKALVWKNWLPFFVALAIIVKSHCIFYFQLWLFMITQQWEMMS